LGKKLAAGESAGFAGCDFGFLLRGVVGFHLLFAALFFEDAEDFGNFFVGDDG
jgi:hypothetical protein